MKRDKGGGNNAAPSEAREPGEPFLARWSRRKLEPTPDEQSPDRGPPPLPETSHGLPATVAAPPPAQLPALDSLDGLNSDYKAFMQPGVGAATRSFALKKLFSDPHFNIMDGLDTYIDDYSIEDPIPDAMLRGLNQARSLMLFEEEKVERAEGEPALAGTEDAPPKGASVALVDAPPVTQPASVKGLDVPVQVTEIVRPK